MDRTLFNEIIKTLLDSKKAGFGYIEDFFELLGQHRSQLNISNAVLFWQYSINNESYRNFRYLNGQKFSLDCFDLIKICNSDKSLDSRMDDLSFYKYSNQFSGFHTIIFPLKNNCKKENGIPVQGFILLLTISQINISLEEIDVISNLIIHSSPKTLNHPTVINALSILMENDVYVQNISLEHRYTAILKSLDKLSAKECKELNKHGLRHFSFWSYDNTDDLCLAKEFNKNTYSELIHKDTYCRLKGQEHYVLDYLNQYYKKLKTCSFNEQILFYDYSRVNGSLKDERYFQQLGLNEITLL